MLPYAILQYGLVATGILLLLGAFYRACRSKPEKSLPMLDSHPVGTWKTDAREDVHVPRPVETSEDEPEWSPKPVETWEKKQCPMIRPALLAKTERMPSYTFYRARTMQTSSVD